MLNKPYHKRLDLDLILGIIVVGVVVAVLAALLSWFFLIPLLGSTNTDPEGEIKAAYDAYFIRGEYDAALNKLQKLTERYPNDARTWRDYGALLILDQPGNTAMEVLEKAKSLNSSDNLTYLYLTSAYLNLYQFDKADESSKAALRLNPDSWVGHAARSQYLLPTLHYDQAQKEIDLVTARKESEAGNYYYDHLMVSSLISLRKYAEALPILDKLLAVQPADYWAMLLKASYLLDNDSVTDSKASKQAALDLLFQAQTLRPQSPFVQIMLAFYYSENDDNPVKAEKYAQEALQSYPENSYSYYLLGKAQVDRLKYSEAVKQFQVCLKINPYALRCAHQWLWALIYEARDLEEEGKQDEAKALLAEAKTKAKEFASYILAEEDSASSKAAYYYTLATIYYQQEDYAAAINNFRMAANLQPDTALYWEWVGWACYEDGRTSDAWEAYQKAVALDPNDSSIKELGKNLKPYG